MNTEHQKRLLMKTGKITLVLFATSIMVLWAWNTTMTTIFGLPAIQFKEAVGLMILAGAVSFMFRGGKHRLHTPSNESS